MPRTTQADRARRWAGRIRQANRAYREWSERYDTDLLEDYYLGRQWKGIPEDDAARRYVINLVYSTAESNRPALVFHRPQIRVQPRPGRARTFASDADNRARLIQDTIQTFVDDPDIDFALETSLALQEAHFRFGVIEVGYTADWIDNPNAGKPLLKESPDGRPIRDSNGQEIPIRDQDGEPVRQPERLIRSEDLYVKRIPASSFRVSISSNNSLPRNDWVGYYEWHYLEDIKANREYKNTANLRATGIVRDRYTDSYDQAERERREGMVRIWKIWDLRAGERFVLAEGQDDKFLQEGRKFTFLPFAIMKLHEVLDSFYPMPPVFQWMGPQDEINETREMQRAHRRRFYRRYTVDPGVDDEELRKLEDGGDGVYAKIPAAQAPVPVPDAPLSADQWRHLDEAKGDFIQVSGVTSEQRGIAESETATQATILDARGRLRESAARAKVADWLSSIARIMILTIRESMALPFWIERNVDPMSEGAAEEALSVAARWERITASELGNIDIDIFIDLASMSPVTEEVLRNSWNQVLALLANPTLAVIFAQSEVILRKTLSLYGIRAESEIREIQRVVGDIAAQALAQQITQAAPRSGGRSEVPAIGGPAPGVESMLARIASVGRQTGGGAQEGPNDQVR